jgi:lysophospholipase L1-like esterase
MKKVKKILGCRVTIFLLVGWAVLSLLGYREKDGLYKNYKTDAWSTPYFVMVFQGIHDGIYPWSSEREDLLESWGFHSEEEPAAVAATEFVEDTEAALTVSEATEESEAVESHEFVEVDDDYFDDAVFIGDSRTVGLRDYGGLDKATFYASTGLSIYDMWDAKFCEVDGEKTTLEDALSRGKFGKIYFQIGINEMGRGTLDAFIQRYEQAIDKFEELQPGAIIYIQGIMRVTKEKSESDAIFNNEGIIERNERIAELADDETVFYIDMNDAVCDKEGNLKANLTFDNLHLYGSKYGVWVDFLKTKGLKL